MRRARKLLTGLIKHGGPPGLQHTGGNPGIDEYKSSWKFTFMQGRLMRTVSHNKMCFTLVPPQKTQKIYFNICFKMCQKCVQIPIMWQDILRVSSCVPGQAGGYCLPVPAETGVRGLLLRLKKDVVLCRIRKSCFLFIKWTSYCCTILHASPGSCNLIDAVCFHHGNSGKRGSGEDPKHHGWSQACGSGGACL